MRPIWKYNFSFTKAKSSLSEARRSVQRKDKVRVIFTTLMKLRFVHPKGFWHREPLGRYALQINTKHQECPTT